MKFAPPFADTFALDALDLAAQPHDFGLGRRQGQFVAMTGESQEAGQSFCFGKGSRRLGEPAILV
ncbi:hypothetical protein [Sphingomonas alba]|uniref:Uncharacterized protein n=1 Tax=Sphingomonas alba TaxID=2908208 RepID=A0ABT0RKC2_9SPHN|nr:hypothetical protein [Sphingomonas alba]MCL6683089.1 hypothetical protein [Sphingomonas alba]